MLPVISPPGVVKLVSYKNTVTYEVADCFNRAFDFYLIELLTH